MTDLKKWFQIHRKLGAFPDEDSILIKDLHEFAEKEIKEYEGHDKPWQYAILQQRLNAELRVWRVLAEATEVKKE